MQQFGMTEKDGEFTYDVDANPLIMPRPLRRTTVAPFRVPVVNDVAPAGRGEYATLRAAAAFARAMESRGAQGIAPANEAATFVTDLAGEGVPKWEIVFSDGRRANAGAIATVLGNPFFGFTAEAKAGHIALLIGEGYDPAVHPALVRSLIAAGLGVL